MTNNTSCAGDGSDEGGQPPAVMACLLMRCFRGLVSGYGCWRSHSASSFRLALTARPVSGSLNKGKDPFPLSPE